ncbi:MAG: hypothetical protein AAF911_08070 [Planctomycetota bacterium]
MAVPTTRELNVKVIFVVTIVSVLLLIAIIYAAQAGFFYFQNQQELQQYSKGAERTYAETGLRMDNLDLARMKVEQAAELEREGSVDVLDADGEVVGQVQMTPIDQAMQQIVEQYAK